MEGKNIERREIKKYKEIKETKEIEERKGELEKTKENFTFIVQT